MSQLKLSLHGEDPRHPSRGGFKLAMDPPDAFERDVAVGMIVGQRRGTLPIWFSGEAINDYATLVMRFRWTWESVVAWETRPIREASRRMRPAWQCPAARSGRCSRCRRRREHREAVLANESSTKAAGCSGGTRSKSSGTRGMRGGIRDAFAEPLQSTSRLAADRSFIRSRTRHHPSCLAWGRIRSDC